MNMQIELGRKFGECCAEAWLFVGVKTLCLAGFSDSSTSLSIIAQMLSSFSCFRFRSYSTVIPFLRRLYSMSPFHVNNNEVDNAVSSFHNMLRMHPTPSIVEFNKILASLVKTKKHYPTAISLYQLLEFNGIMPNIVTFNTVINCYFEHLD
jgi:hypothetical protein